MPYASKEEEKEKQAELKRQQQLRDNNNTFGNVAKDPCKKERALSLKCIEFNASNHQEECKNFFDNYKSCIKFWAAVRKYRAQYKSQYDYPDDQERELYKKQLKNWLKTEKIVDPDTIKE